MSHTADVANSREIRRAGDVELEKGVSYLRPGEGTKSLWVMGELLTYKIPSLRTGGAYSLFEVTTHPGAGPHPHVHHREDESFYVLEGEYEFLIGGETLRVGAGSLLYVPKGALHTHRNVGESVGRMLMNQTPGGLHECFFEEIGEERRDGFTRPLSEDPQDAERIARIAAEYGIEMPLPGRSHEKREGIPG